MASANKSDCHVVRVYDVGQYHSCSDPHSSAVSGSNAALNNEKKKTLK